MEDFVVSWVWGPKVFREVSGAFCEEISEVFVGETFEVHSGVHFEELEEKIVEGTPEGTLEVEVVLKGLSQMTSEDLMD